MARRYFHGRSREWLEKQLEKAQNDLASGKTLVSWGEGDSSGSKQVQSSPQARIDMLLNDLTIIAPEDFAADDVLPITEARPNFSGMTG